jgi:hypothetical protein
VSGTDKQDAYDPLVAAANWVQHRAGQAVEIASAALAVQLAILQGMINAGIVDRQAMRAWLQSVLDALPPNERPQAYGQSLAHLIAHLDDQAGATLAKLH